MKILDTKLIDDSGTIRSYLKELLATLWEEGESFSGKRPLGNSGWQDDLYSALVKAGLLVGKFDGDGYLTDCDTDAGYKLILEAIESL